MEAIILVIHLIVAISIICIIMIQPAESGGFLGSGGSMSNAMAPRRSADVLTRATTILAGIFFATSLILAVMAGNRPVQNSILDAVSSDAAPAVEAPADASPSAPAAEATKPADKKPAAAPKAPLPQ